MTFLKIRKCKAKVVILEMMQLNSEISNVWLGGSFVSSSLKILPSISLALWAEHKLWRSFSMPIYAITISQRSLHILDQIIIFRIFCNILEKRKKGRFFVSPRSISFRCNAAHFHINPKGSIIPLHKIWLSGSILYLFHGGKNCKVVLLIDLWFPLNPEIRFSAEFRRF